MQKDCYILDIMNHGIWTNQHLVEVAVRNWPDAELFFELKGVSGTQWSSSGRSYSGDDRKTLRAAGIATFVEVEGRVLMPRSGGISTAGTSVQSVRQAQQLLRSLKRLEDGLNADPNFLKAAFDQAGLRYPNQPDLHLVLHDFGDAWDWIVYEASGANLTNGTRRMS